MTYTRVREHGTVETLSDNATDRIKAIQDVIDHGYAKIDGCMMDSTTAHMLMTVYRALNDENKVKFASFPVYKMVDIGWKLVK